MNVKLASLAVLAAASLATALAVNGCTPAACSADSDCIDPDEPVCSDDGTCVAGGDEGEGEAGEGEGEGAGEGEGEGGEGEGEGNGPCLSKCDCLAGQVCEAGACTAPPAECTTDDDCPRGAAQCVALTCSALSGQCEGDEEPEPCVVDEDCDTEQICNQGLDCVCNEGNCTPQAPTCASNADCTTAPLTACDLETGQCTFGNCTNGGVVCDEAAGETCAENGECINGSGAPCTNDDECVDAAEYCDLPAFGEDPGACVTGCRTSADCAGQICSGGHTCVDSAGGSGDACVEDGDCGEGMSCGAFSQTCVESCTVPEAGPECTDGACCAFSGEPCCNEVFGGFAFCGACG